MQILAGGGGTPPDMAAWRARLERNAFKGLDSDGNGQVSQAEFKAALQKLPGGTAGPAGTAASGSVQAAGPDGGLKVLDSNGDGRVSGAEFHAGLAAQLLGQGQAVPG